jgi:hypothetical protein
MNIKTAAPNTPDAADKSNPFGADLWLHVATDCLRRYARDCAVSVLAQRDGIVITLSGITAQDARLHQGFLPLIQPPGEQSDDDCPEKRSPEPPSTAQLALFEVEG